MQICGISGDRPPMRQEIPVFRPFDESLSPDPRFAYFRIPDPVEGLRELRFEDHHADIDAIAIPQCAPHDVREAFDRSRNCFLYAWFSYELTVVAESQALASLELALKERLGALVPPVKKLRGLGARLSAAVKRGILAAPNSTPGVPDRHFIVSAIRNELSHGSKEVHTPDWALDVIRMCAELITELYPSTDK